MKKLSLFFFLALFVSCQNSKTHPLQGFRGFGSLTIGNPLDSINLKLFDKVSDEEYTCPKMDLTKDVGYVENVTFKTLNGKLYYVTFESGEFSNEYVIEGKFVGMDHKGDGPDKDLQITTYKGDNGIGAMKVAYKGMSEINYSYYNDSIYSDIANKDYEAKREAEKQEYLKDVRK